MQRSSNLIYLVLLLVFISVSPVLAEVPQQVGLSATTTEKLNLRSGPGTHWRLVGTLEAGVSVRLDGRDHRAEWVRGLAAGSEVAWMAAHYLSLSTEQVAALPIISVDTPSSLAGSAPAASASAPASNPAAAPGGPGISAQTTATVNVRSGPGTTYEKIASLKYQAEVNANGRSAGQDWVRVAFSGGTGWVSVSFLSLTAAEVASLPVMEGGAVVAPDAPAAPAAPAITHTAAVRGFNLGGHVSGFGPATVAAMQRAGMTWVKKQIRISDGGGSGAISDAHAKGFRILLGVVGSPSSVNDPDYIARYAQNVASLAAAGADAIEIWNEQNLDRERAAGSIDPARYTELLRQSYNAIKAANPNTLVISGAPAPTGFFGGCTPNGCDDKAFLAGMAAAGAANYMDCVGVHYNEGIVSPGQRTGDPRGNSGHYTRYFWGMVDTYYNAFGGARPLCFTELGYLSPQGFGSLPEQFAWAANVTVAQQASWLAEAVSLSRNSGKVRLLIIWNVDFTSYGSDPMAGYAMIRPDGSCPACAALGGR